MSSSPRWLIGLYWFALLSWCSIPLSPNVTDSDFWGHVQYGRDLLAHGLPSTATYGYTAIGYPWVNHELLSEVAFAVGCDTFGSGSLLVLKSVLGLVVLFSMIRLSRRQGTGIVATSVVVVAVAWNLSYYWGTRPQVSSFLLFALMLRILLFAFDDWRGCLAAWARASAANGEPLREPRVPRRLLALALLIPVFAVWANAHGGFLAGTAILGCYLSVRLIEGLYRTGTHAWRPLLIVALTGITAGLATLLNPYGMGLHVWLVQSLGVPRPEILEWHAPAMLSWESAPLWCLIGLAAWGLFAGKRPWDWAHVIVFLVTLWQVAQHRRHLPFLAIEVGYWLIPDVDAALRRLLPARRVATRSSSDVHPVAPPVHVPGLVMAIAPILLVAGVWWSGQWLARVQSMRVAADRFPVSAFEYIAERGLRGRLLSTGKWAQYAIATFGARLPQDAGIQVAFDGRFRTCYPQEIVDLHFDFTLGAGGPETRYRSPQSPPPEGGRMLEVGEPDLVLIDRHERHSAQVMRAHSRDWVLLYQDDLAQLWARRSRYGDPASSKYVPEKHRRIGEMQQVGWVSWPAAPGFST